MTDDELFEALTQALSPVPPQPSPAAVLALRRAVGEARPARSSPPWWRRRLLAVTMMVPMVLGGSTAAYALTGAALPEPVRAAANAVGLPVDSVAVADARAAAAKLKVGLHEHDRVAVDEAARR
ncbi:MAG: hypothetical protein M3N98_14230, partial [Actinomycetota bacterium]|nr:hypothetical protein [Actinomycetota bacterium]